MTTNTGSIYDPATNSWTATSTSGGPMQGSSQHYAFWTGTDMILIGEYFGPGTSNFRYNLSADVWSQNTTLPFSAPSMRSNTTAQWTGIDVLIGYSAPMSLQSYSAVANFWQALTSSSINPASPLSVWTGNEMIVWGLSWGLSGFTVSQAARYSPSTGSWTTISSLGAPTRPSATAVWTGTEMILWGGRLGSGPGNETVIHDTGSRYRLPQNYYFYRRP